MQLKNLVTAADVKDATVVQLSVDDHKLDAVAPLVQRRYLRPVLGAALYNELVAFAQVETSDTEDALAALLHEVKQMLSAWVVVEAWPGIIAAITNGGIKLMGGGEGSTHADYKTAQDLLASKVDAAHFETSELQAWLYEHRADYPSYPQPGPVAQETMPLGGIQF